MSAKKPLIRALTTSLNMLIFYWNTKCTEVKIENQQVKVGVLLKKTLDQPLDLLP